MKVGAATAVVAALLCLASAAAAGTLDRVKARGHLQCGVGKDVPGFSSADAEGAWRGLDVDVCRAAAAAIFQDAGKVAFVPLSPIKQFAPLQAGDIDILSSTTTWSMSLETGLGLAFPAVTYYDGQGFLVRRMLGIASALELSQATVCAQKDATAVANVADFFQVRRMPYELLAFDTAEEALGAYEAERCAALTADLSHLHAKRLKLARPDDHMVLPEVISKEPLGPVVRGDDTQWLNLVKWTVFAMINAEELGVTSGNADDLRGSANPEIRRLLGSDGDYGLKIGLDKAWAYRVIRQVGNYGEVFERNLGKGSPLKIARGINALWNKGGVLYAPPIR